MNVELADNALSLSVANNSDEELVVTDNILSPFKREQGDLYLVVRGRSGEILRPCAMIDIESVPKRTVLRPQQTLELVESPALMRDFFCLDSQPKVWLAAEFRSEGERVMVSNPIRVDAKDFAGVER